MSNLRGMFYTVISCKNILNVNIKPVEKFGFLDVLRA